MYARTSGCGWVILAPAKINLTLEVLGRRADGFHEVETLMTPIGLYDRLQWRSAGANGAFSLVYDDATPPHVAALAPPDASNLIWKAAIRLANLAGIEPYGAIRVEKRIPAQAGLGGGSSDAAATLLLLNSAWRLNYPREKLAPLAAEMGSDVSFFLQRGAAVCRGRGELVEPLPGPLPRLDLVVVAPEQGVPTAAAFARLKAPPLASDERSHGRGPRESAWAATLHDWRELKLARLAGALRNDLLEPAVQLCSAVRRVLELLNCRRFGPYGMSGSGSALFAVLPSARAARRAARLVSASARGRVWATATCVSDPCVR